MTDVPVIPPLTPEQKRQRDNPGTDLPVAKCGECGILLYKVMNYTCGNTHCPVFPRVT